MVPGNYLSVTDTVLLPDGSYTLGLNGPSGSTSATFSVSSTSGLSATQLPQNNPLVTLQLVPCMEPPSLVVTTTADVVDPHDFKTSLREAINYANANPGQDTITFAIPTTDPGYDSTTGAFTIKPTSALPTLTDAVVIDGYTQPGASPNTLTIGDNAVLKIVLDGSMAGTVDGLVIAGGNSTVRGLVIDNFAPGAIDSYAGLVLSGSGNDIVTGNFIGTDVTGEFAAANANGISVSSPSNTIGDTAPADRNIISGNNAAQPVYVSQNGIELGSNIGSTGTLIEGNYIGTDKSGTSALGNYGGIIGGNYSTIGGLTTTPGIGAGNVISGNTGTGVWLSESHNVVAGNLIGTDATGLAALGNAGGILMWSNYNTIGGTTAGARNIISGNGPTGGGHWYRHCERRQCAGWRQLQPRGRQLHRH
jgi:CSLREA domain-containing protein